MRVEIEMRMGMANARLSAGDGSVTLDETWGNPYSLIHTIKDVRATSGLPIREA